MNEFSSMSKEDMVSMLRNDIETWNRLRQECKVQLKNLCPDLSDIDLSDTNLSYANLSHTDLINTDLPHAILSNADLSSANLSCTDLSNANLARANLSHANIAHADLSHANLLNANLSHADLSHANLINANLSYTSLDQINFEGAFFWGTIFGDVQLKSAIGLNDVTHWGPSAIDLGTLSKSWPLPKNFLRGCGLPEAFIDYLPSFFNDPLQFYSCFISHSSADKSFARKLENDLQAQGVRCWFDEKAILPGDKIAEQIDMGIKIHEKTILICSKNSLTSWWVEKEIEKTLRHERDDWGMGNKTSRIIPITIDDYVFDDWDSGNKDSILGLNVGNFRNWEDGDAYKKSFERLMKALDQAHRP